jgi:hypothetical protein
MRFLLECQPLSLYGVGRTPPPCCPSPQATIPGGCVASFMNAQGGTLFIGIDDDGNPVGLDRDLGTLSKPNLDDYQLFLRNLFNAAVGTDLCARIGIEFPMVDGTQAAPYGYQPQHVPYG